MSEPDTVASDPSPEASAPKPKMARTGPTAKTAAKADPKPVPTKKAVKIKSVHKPSISASESMRNAELAIRAIDKFTKGEQKPIGFNAHPLPCVPTGAFNLDHIIGGVQAPDKSGPLCPGYPRGRITEIYGPEASGKTTLALEAIAEVQRQGGSAMFLDFEYALNHKYAKDLGVDFDRLMLYQPTNMEQGLDMMRLGLGAGVDLIVVDSIAAMVPKADMEKDFADPDRIGGRARALASALPKIVRLLKPHEKNPQGTAVVLINQTRALISTGPMGGGNDKTTSGGFALKFFAYLRLQTTCIRTERIATKDPVTKKDKKIPFGSHTQVKVVKSKVDAKQGQSTDIFIRYGQGIDDIYTIIEAGVAHRHIKKGGAMLELDGQRFQGRERLRAFLMNDSKALETLQAALIGSLRKQAELDAVQAAEEEEDEVDNLLTSTFGSDDPADESEDLIPDEVELESEEAGD